MHRRSRFRFVLRPAPPAAIALLAVVAAVHSEARAQHAADTVWLGADPHVPLALVRDGAIESVSTGAARQRACRDWSRPGRDWIAVDRFGQSLGVRRLAGRDFYDATGCYEASFPDDPEDWNQWRPGKIVLYARGPFRAAPPLEWRPSAAIRDEHRRFVDSLAAAVLPPARTPGRSIADGPPLAESDRTLFFQVHDPGDPANGVAPRERSFAVSGGMALVVAERAGDGRWFARFVDNSLGSERSTNRQAYRPLAVFDMNGDGWPEVVVHEAEGGGESYGDIIVSVDGNGVWSIVARSVGGSTA